MSEETATEPTALTDVQRQQLNVVAAHLEQVAGMLSGAKTRQDMIAFRERLGAIDMPPIESFTGEEPEGGEGTFTESFDTEEASDAKLGRELVALLTPYAGDGGEDEGAVECLRRLLVELDEWSPERKPKTASAPVGG